MEKRPDEDDLQPWQQGELTTAGPPEHRIGAGGKLPIARKSVRIAPSRNGKPLTSFWSFWLQGSEIYASARSVSGVHKLSFHKNGIGLSGVGKDRERLAPPWLMPGGKWLHALDVQFLIGDGALPPRPEKRFKESDPGWTVAIPQGDFLTVQLLFGADGTSLDTPLPTNWNWPVMLDMTRRDNRCAKVVCAHFPMRKAQKDKLEFLRSMRFQTANPTVGSNGSIEVHEIAISEVNVVTVVPLGPEAFTDKPAPLGAPRLKLKVKKPR